MALQPKRYWRKQALLAKIETDYGVDAAPTGAADAMLITNTQVTPIDGEEIERDYYLPWLGNQGILPVGSFGRIEFDVDVAGSGTAGTPPACGPLFRGCGMAEVIDAGVEVTYTSISSAFENLTLAWNGDGVQHVLLGARGTWRVEPAPRTIPRFRFTFTGLLGSITDVALPAANLAAHRKAIPVTKDNSAITLAGANLIGESVTIDLGNQVETRMLIGEDSIQIVDRRASGQVVVEAVPMATKNWFNEYRNATLNSFKFQHGMTAGNIVEFESAGVQIGKPTYGESQGVTNQTLPLYFTAVAGNDDMVVRFR